MQALHDHSNQIDLSTPIVDLSSQQEISVFYRKFKAAPFNQPAKIKLYLSSTSESIGEIVITRKKGEPDPDNFDIFAPPLIDPDYPEYFTIVDMTNLFPKQYKHVGMALYEIVFRESMRCGCHGRLVAEAVRDSHAFHYKMGMRIRNMSMENSIEEKQQMASQYYGKIAEALSSGRMLKGKDHGSQYIFLPNYAIPDMAKKFGLVSDVALYHVPSANIRYPVEHMMTLSQQPESIFDCHSPLSSELQIPKYGNAQNLSSSAAAASPGRSIYSTFPPVSLVPQGDTAKAANDAHVRIAPGSAKP